MIWRDPSTAMANRGVWEEMSMKISCPLQWWKYDDDDDDDDDEDEYSPDSIDC